MVLRQNYDSHCCHMEPNPWHKFWHWVLQSFPECLRGFEETAVDEPVVRTCAPSLTDWAVSQLRACLKVDFWYLSFFLYTLYPTPLLYYTGYLIKGWNVSHSEEFLSYFCRLLNWRGFYVTASACFQWH